MLKLTCSGLLCVVFISVTTALRADEDNADTEKATDELTAQRYKLMEDRMASTLVSSQDESFPKEFAPKPVFRYTDPARSYVAAAVWKLGEQGRPKAFITTELHRRYAGSPRIVYEYLSVTPAKFKVMSDALQWEPQGTDVDFRPVPDAAVPESSPQRRLLQMRAIAKRFTGDEVVENEKCELRLMPQPIDRYTPSDAKNADGGVFLMSFGTNPEVMLFIESDGEKWSYAAGRLSGASTIALQIDGTPAWEGKPVQYGIRTPYTASNSAAQIPGIDPNGSEVKP